MYQKIAADVWGPYEPGEVGDCAVLDSSLRWAWNAIGCNVYANFACQGQPRMCPSPSLPVGTSILNGSSLNNWWISGTKLQLTCDKGNEGGIDHSKYYFSQDFNQQIL